MENLETINLVKDIRNLVNVQQNTEKLYNKFKNFIYYMAAQLKVPCNLIDDFMQYSYIALVNAVHSYDYISANSFSHYYSLFIRHEYYDYFLRMYFPLRISHKFYKNYKDKGHYLLEHSIPIEYYLDDYQSEDLPFEEYSILKIEVWTIVHENVTDLNFYIIQQRFIKDRTLENIANELGIGKSRVRQRIIRCFNRLRKNEYLRALASDYFKIL